MSAIELRIVDWSRHFERRDLRRCRGGLSAIALPTKRRGFFSELVHGDRDGWAHYGIWCALLGLAAEGRPDERGRVAAPSLEALSGRIGCAVEALSAVLLRLTKLGVLVLRNLGLGSHPDAVRMPSGCRPDAVRTEPSPPGREPARDSLFANRLAVAVAVEEIATETAKQPSATGHARALTEQPDCSLSALPNQQKPTTVQRDRTPFSEQVRRTIDRMRGRPETPQDAPPPASPREPSPPVEAQQTPKGGAREPNPRMAPSAKFTVTPADLDGRGPLTLFRRLTAAGALAHCEASLVWLLAVVHQCRAAGRNPERLLAWSVRNQDRVKITGVDEDAASRMLRELRYGSGSTKRRTHSEPVPFGDLLAAI